MDLGEVGGEEGDQAVGVGVPDNEQLGSVGMLRPHHRQGLVAPHEKGVLVLFLQLRPVVEAPRLGLRSKPGGHLHPVLRHVLVDDVRRHPPHAGGGKGGAVEVGGDRGLFIGAQGYRVQSHGLRQGGVAVIGPQAGPVVVQPVVDVLPGMGQQSPLDIHPSGPGGGRRLPEDGALVGVGSPLRQPVRPHRDLTGDQGKVHRNVNMFHQFVHII